MSEATSEGHISEGDQSTGELQSIVWGWQAFFDCLSHFLLSVDLRAGVASKNYIVYAMERLETCLMNERLLREHLLSVRYEEDAELDTNELLVVQMYDDQLGEFLT